MIKNSIGIFGPPGTGKTKELVNRIEETVKTGKNIAVFSHSKAAAKELVSRIKAKLSFVGTIHSYCFHFLDLTRSAVVEKADFTEFIGEFLREEQVFFVLDLIGYSEVSGIPLKEVYSKLSVESNSINWNYVEFIEKSYYNWKRNNGLYDFSDMLKWCVKQMELDVPHSRFDYIFVDEAQDLSQLQWKLMRLLLTPDGVLTAAGDDDQCQPGNVWVETMNGRKRIQELDSNNDRLLSYARHDSQVYGKSNGYKFKKSCRSYTGNLFTIYAGGMQTQCTANHRWLVKWKSDIKHSKLYCVYLMRKGNWFRIGRCQVFNSEGTFHGGIRMRQEGADSLWILKLTENLKEAAVLEQVLVCKYGIPDVVFKIGKHWSGKFLSNDEIQKIFERIPTETKAKSLLIDFGLELKYPFWTQSKAVFQRGGKSIMELEACNIYPNYMQIPVWNGGKIAPWTIVDQIDKELISDIPVYSLDVEKHHTYIVDGLVTKNSIFTWSGANPQGMIENTEHHIILKKSFRLPEEIWKKAIAISSKIQDRKEKLFLPMKKAGKINYQSFLTPAFILNLIEDSKGKILILCRDKWGIKEVEEVMVMFGIPYMIEGGSNAGLFSDRIAAVARMIDSGDFNIKKISNWLKTEAIVQFESTGKMPVWWKAIRSISFEQINYLFKTGLHSEVRIHLSTIHSQKGREADNVIVVGSTTRRSAISFFESQEAFDSELRVWYVAMTRSRQNLYIIGRNNFID